MSSAGRRSAPTGLPSAPGWLRDVPLAHRGLHGDGVAENSLAAFDAAATAGYGVELDVLLSRDEVPVVVHDPTLRRVAGLDRRVAELTAAELGRTRLHGGDEIVPTLEQSIDVLGDAPVMVELKQPRLRAGRLEARTATVLDTHRGPWCVASFNPSTVRWFRRNRPGAIRVLTSGRLTDVPLPGPIRARLSALREIDSVMPHAVSYELDGLPCPPTDTWRERGGVLIAWTAVGADQVARARRLADNVIFEHAHP